MRHVAQDGFAVKLRDELGALALGKQPIPPPFDGEIEHDIDA
jgi:hypothetical protein